MIALRIDRELPAATDERVSALYSDLVAYWSARLLPHFSVEGECLLARLIRHVPESGAHVQRLEHDHLSIAALVATMRDTDDPAVRRQALADFGREIREHLRWEEVDLFPLTEQTLTKSELDALGADLSVRLPEQPAGFPMPPLA